MAIISDSSGGFYRTLYMNKDAVIENPSFLSHTLLTQILFQASQFGASKENPFILAIDSSSWRKEFYPDYKGNRVKDPSIPWDTVFEIYNDVIDTLKNYSDFHVYKVPRAEADDIIAVLSRYYHSKGEQVFVITSDKDFIQIQNQPSINLYDPIKKCFRPPIDIELWKKVHILMGDKVDNIPAVKKGVAEKTAMKMVPELDVLLQTNVEIRENYARNEKLIDFSFIPDDIQNAIIAQVEEQTFGHNAMKLLNTFMKYKLVKHTEDLGRFKLPEKAVKTKLNQYFANISKEKEVTISNLDDFFS